ncbi:MAG: ribonuclease III [Mariprofundaceae bacterium]|nr:ribonuclease III [Mariprofundaceae bacterium]
MKSHKLAHQLGVSFCDGSLLQRALTHCSYGMEHMERLEFLGDAVLGLVVAEYLHERFPNEAEGQLSRLRASLVRKESLYAIAQIWQLEGYLRVGEGERSKQGGVKSNSIVANAVEAVLGAVFKDAGWDAVRPLILKAWQPLFESLIKGDARDAKSQLQEYTQGKNWGLPTYEVIDLGVNVSPRFQASCYVQGVLQGKGMGERKKFAELAAAHDVLKKNKVID